MAIYGWSSASMAQLYTRTADRKRLAQDAIEFLLNKKRPPPWRR